MNPMPVRRGVGIRAVAEEAGVSIATVSNVLNRPEVVRAELQQRVRAAMDELGFVPNAAARSLRSGHANSIGAVFFDLANPFFSKVARQMGNVASARGFMLSVMSTDQDLARERSSYDFLIMHGIRGVAVTTSFEDLTPVRELRTRGLEVLLLAQAADDDDDLGFVCVDDRVAMMALTRHILATGRRRIGFIDGPGHARQHEQRRNAVSDTIAAAGLDLTAHLHIVTAPSPDIDGGRHAAEELMRTGPRDVDAVMCVNDFTAMGAMASLTAAGRVVPDDVAITGFDDIDVAGLLAVPLTTVRQPLDEIGTVAASTLIDVTVQPGTVLPRLTLPSEVIIRGSTAA